MAAQDVPIEAVTGGLANPQGQRTFACRWFGCLPRRLAMKTSDRQNPATRVETWWRCNRCERTWKDQVYV